MIQLLKHHKNGLFKRIKEVGLDPNDFILDNLVGKNREVLGWHILYPKGNYFFRTFSEISPVLYQDYTVSEYSPGDNFFIERKKETGINPASYQFSFFEKWLKNLKQEIEEVDEWENLKRAINEFKPTFYGIEIPKEERFVKNIVDEIIRRLPEANLNNRVEQQIIIHLNQTSIIYEQNKDFDWFGYVIGTITSIMITMLITPEQGKALYDIISSVFKRLLHQ